MHFELIMGSIKQNDVFANGRIKLPWDFDTGKFVSHLDKLK